MEMNDIYVSVILPAFNEEGNIGETLTDVGEYLAGKTFDSEVIVVDDGSSDKTYEEASGYAKDIKNLKVIKSSPNQGKGYVLRKAVGEAVGKYIMFMDADNATSIRELDKFLPHLEGEYDVVIGTRRHKESDIAVSESAMRIILGQIYIMLSRLIIGARASDFNCGFKAYKGDIAKKLFSLQKINGWAFDTELIFLINKYKMPMKEVPVRWEHKDTSKVKPLQAGIESFLSLVDIKRKDMAGEYKL